MLDLEGEQRYRHDPDACYGFAWDAEWLGILGQQRQRCCSLPLRLWPTARHGWLVILCWRCKSTVEYLQWPPSTIKAAALTLSQENQINFSGFEKKIEESMVGKNAFATYKQILYKPRFQAVAWGAKRGYFWRESALKELSTDCKLAEKGAATIVIDL